MKEGKSLGDWSSAFFTMAIANEILNIQIMGIQIPLAKAAQKTIRNLKRRGIAIVEIIDKTSETTYHPQENIEKVLNDFVKKNNKWVLKKEIDFGIKTGKYILTRVYRKYYSWKPHDTCECCGQELLK